MIRVLCAGALFVAIALVLIFAGSDGYDRAGSAASAASTQPPSAESARGDQGVHRTAVCRSQAPVHAFADRLRPRREPVRTPTASAAYDGRYSVGQAGPTPARACP